MKKFKNFVVTYYGSAYEKNLLFFRNNTFLDIKALPILMTPEYLSSSMEFVNSNLISSADRRAGTFEKIKEQYERVLKFKKPDPLFSDFEDYTNFYESLLSISDLFFIDASQMNSAIGQWFISNSLTKNVWALGEGMHNSPLAAQHIKGVLYPKSQEDFLGLFDMTYNLTEKIYHIPANE